MVRVIRIFTATASLLTLQALFPLSTVLADSEWGSPQIIDEHSDWATMPQVAINGAQAVVVWSQSNNCVGNHSVDGGATWEGAQTISAGTSTYCDAPQVSMSGANVVAVWYEVVGSSRISANYSTDGGATWGSAAVISDSVSVASTPHVAVSGDIVIATWAANDASYSTWYIYSNRSEDGGATWEGAQLIASGAGYTYNSTDDYPRVAVDGAVTVVAWVTMEGQAPWRKDVHSVHSADGGATWGTSQVISTGAESYAPRLALSGSTVVAIWNDNDGNTSVYANHSSDGGATWDGVENIDNGAVGGKYSPQLAMSGSGVVAVWYQWGSGTGIKIRSNRSGDAGASWDGAQTVDSSTTWDAYEPHVALSGTNAVTVWYQFDGTASRAYSSYSADGGATWGSPTLIQNDVEVSGFFVRVAASGRHAVAVWCQQESVVDVYSNHLTMLETPPTFLGAWGTHGAGDSQFEGPQGVAVSSEGTVYVSDTGNHRVQRFTTTGSYVTQWGSPGTDKGEFYQPIHLTAPTGDSVYVADGGNHRVQYFDRDGTFAGQFGSFGAGDGEFNWTYGIAVDSFFDVYVTDWGNNRVQAFEDDIYFYQWGGGLFDGPFGLAIDADHNIYVAEYSSNRIQKYGGAEWTVFNDSSDLNHPSGIAVDADGRLYVCDTDNHRIQVFDSEGNLVTRWGSYGTGPGQFKRPMGIAIHPNGDIYVADTDNHRIQVFSYNAAAHTIALEVGWNMISMPLHLVGGAPDLVFGDSIVSIYEWNADGGTYGEPESIQYGKGYWVRSDTGDDVTVYGIAATVEDWQCEVFTGWNMIGAASETTTVSGLADDLGDPLSHNGVYWWNRGASEYEALYSADALVPGAGYWLAATEDGTITMTPPGA